MSRKNYTDKEKEELLRLTEKYKTIVQDKGTKAIMVEKKKKAWERISKEFNKTAETPRTGKQLWQAYFNHRKPLITADGEVYSYVGAHILKMENQKDISPNNNCDVPNKCCTPVEDMSSDSNSNSIISNFSEEKHQSPNNTGIEVVMLPATQRNNVKRALPYPSYGGNDNLNKSTIRRKEIRSSELYTLRKQFFKTKLQSAVIEKRTNLTNYKIALNKAKLVEMELKLKKLEYSLKNAES